jgi:two-component system chemotaxis response regulator CheV
MKSEILMEAGTNELEILVFFIGKERFGVNIAKVREVIRPVTLTAPPNSHPHLEGVFNLRERIIPVLSLARVLNVKNELEKEEHKIVVMEYHSQWFGFIVDKVDKIYRTSWKDIEPPPSDVSHVSTITGIAHVEDQLIMMLDVEKVTGDFIPSDRIHPEDHAGAEIKQLRNNKKLLVADDSGMMRQLISQILDETGYTNYDIASDGAEAWKLVNQSRYDLVLTDIEMPQMDGLHLTKRIKSEEELKDIPVVIFSSIISEDNRNKGDQVGADAQIAKPQFKELAAVLDQFLMKTVAV